MIILLTCVFLSHTRQETGPRGQTQEPATNRRRGPVECKLPSSKVLGLGNLAQLGCRELPPPSLGCEKKDEGDTYRWPRTVGVPDVGVCWVSFTCSSRLTLRPSPPCSGLGGESLDQVNLAHLPSVSIWSLYQAPNFLSDRTVFCYS